MLWILFYKKQGIYDMTKKRESYALHVLDCIDKLKEISKRGNILEDFILYDAALRNLQILSESTTHLPEDLKLRYPNINWRGINGFRNILVHDYLGEIDHQTVVKIIDEYLPDLESIIKNMLRNS